MCADSTAPRVEDVMGMGIVLDVRDGDIEEADVDHAFDWLRFVDETFSTSKPESEISRIDRGELSPADAHPQVRAVLERCEELREETNGFFDARAAGSLDPSGLVKGWAVDEAAAILEQRGAQSYAIYAGGDVIVHGHPEPGDRWHVGIRHPQYADELAAVVEATDLAVATSGAYARGDHVLDPHTGQPPSGLLSVTITGPELATADAYATAAFAMGAERGPAWTALLDGYEAFSILENGTALSTTGFPALA